MDHYRILFFISSLRPGGAENHLLNLCRYLKASSHDVAVCTLSRSEDGLESAFLCNGITLYRLPLSSLIEVVLPKKLAALFAIARRFRPDLVHAHLYSAEVVSTLASLVAGVPLVVTRHSSGLEFGGARRKVIGLIRRRCSRIVAVSRDAASEAAGMGYAGDRIVIVPNGVDTRRFRPLGASEREARRIEFIGRLFQGGARSSCVLVGSVSGLKAVKNLELFVRAAAMLVLSGKAGGADFRFVIVGEGPERERLEALVHELGLDARIAMPGYSDRPEDVYPLLDVFMLTSLQEGVPMAVLEAMASGVPCVSSDVGEVASIIGETGRLVRPHDLEGFVEAAQLLTGDGVLRSELGRKARVRIMEHYDVDIWGDRTLAVYRSVVRAG